MPVEYITPLEGASIPATSVEAIDLAIARLKGARYWAQMAEWHLAGLAVDGARQALAVAV
jgi:hypothetical protein